MQRRDARGAPPRAGAGTGAGTGAGRAAPRQGRCSPSWAVRGRPRAGQRAPRRSGVRGKGRVRSGGRHLVFRALMGIRRSTQTMEPGIQYQTSGVTAREPPPGSQGGSNACAAGNPRNSSDATRAPEGAPAHAAGETCTAAPGAREEGVPHSEVRGVGTVARG